MAREILRLTALGVSRETRPGYHADGDGLYLQVSRSGTKSWLYKYTLKGTTREMGLGPLAETSLSEARYKAGDARKLCGAGIDPIDARRAAVAALTPVPVRYTFRQAATDYLQAHRSEWNNAKHAAQWESTLVRFAYPVIGDLPVEDIEEPHVLEVIEPLWSRINETASRLRERIELVMDLGAVRKRRISDNPARWKYLKSNLAKRSAVKKVRHHPALPYADLPSFMVDLRKRAGLGARALDLTILTALRTQEVIGARWNEIELRRVPVVYRVADEEITVTGPCWLVPASRMKIKTRDHCVPLSGPAVELLESLPRGSHFVFPGERTGKHLSNMTMLKTLKAASSGDFVVHGFRASFRSWAGAKTAFPREVCEMALAHAIGDDTEKAYMRDDLYDKRRELMAVWGTYCTTPPPAAAVGNVVQMHGRESA